MDKSWAIVEMKDVQEPWVLPLNPHDGSSLSLPPAATNRFLASSYRSARWWGCGGESRPRQRMIMPTRHRTCTSAARAAALSCLWNGARSENSSSKLCRGGGSFLPGATISRSVHQDFTRCSWSTDGSGLAVQRNMSGSTVITLSRPDKLNALDLGMVKSLGAAMERDDGEGRQTIINGSGRAFCAGGDINVFLGAKRAPMDVESPDLKFFRNLFQLMNLIGETASQRICLVHGPAAGTGMCMSMLSGSCVITQESSFSMPETIIGLTPSAGGSYFLPAFPKNIGIYLGLLGGKITAREAVSLGIATHTTTPDDIRNMLLEAPMHDTLEILEEHAAESEREWPEEWGPDSGPTLAHADAIERCFSHTSMQDIREALRSEASSRGVHAGWAQEQLKELETRPPLCLAVSLESLSRGRATPDLGTCLRDELRATRRLLAGSDFGEAVACRFGSRKGQAPRWEVGGDPTRDQVLEHFEPMPADADLDMSMPGWG